MRNAWLFSDTSIKASVAAELECAPLLPDSKNIRLLAPALTLLTATVQQLSSCFTLALALFPTQNAIH
jgi:hypothetical protein